MMAAHAPRGVGAARFTTRVEKLLMNGAKAVDAASSIFFIQCFLGRNT
jgi:hypothetical protein